MNKHPHLKTLHSLYQTETQAFRKVHRMIDLFESIIKSHTVVILGEYVKHNKLSDTAKGMLAQGLRPPSLGTWQLFSRVGGWLCMDVCRFPCGICRTRQGAECRQNQCDCLSQWLCARCYAYGCTV